MKSIALAAFAALAAGCCITCRNDKVSAVSPDGRNEIRLYAEPLAFEVLRDGKVVVAKSEIGMTIDGQPLSCKGGFTSVVKTSEKGVLETPVYKKASIDLATSMTRVDCGIWGVDIAARNDGVAYRFRSQVVNREITVDSEKADVVPADPKGTCWFYHTGYFGDEESIAKSMPVDEVRTADKEGPKNWGGSEMIYMPMLFKAAGKYVLMTDADVYDYPVWNVKRGGGVAEAKFESVFAKHPKKTVHATGWGKSRKTFEKGGRWISIVESEDFITKTAGIRTFPWRCFMLADEPGQFCESDIVFALSRPQAPKGDFSWVRPGKVAWDWWNCFDNRRIPENKGINTKTYERFIDFASKNGVEYVIFDEGWSEDLNIWKYHPSVDVPHLVDYAAKRGVGIILWMAWAQVCGDEAKVADYFGKLGVKGFKVDFMDRGDAAVERFLWKLADECAKRKLVVDYHGVHRPTGMSRAYPNVLNYEGIHGLEQAKWFSNKYDFPLSDVRSFFLRMSAGQMDYTPGAMLNFPIGKYVNEGGSHPGSVGTRCRQMAMMALYEAPLQMLCDSPTNYENNMESFKFMAATPVVWADTKALGGGVGPDSVAGCARKAKDGSWYAAAICSSEATTFELDTSFLGGGSWNAEIFRDGAESAEKPTTYVHETKSVASGDKIAFQMAPGGGFVVKFTK